MIRGFADQVVSEMKTHPFTLVTVILLVVYAAVGVNIYAKADDVEEVKIEVTAEVQQVKSDVQDQGRKIDRVLKLQIAETIRTIRRQICAEEDNVERRELRNTLEQLQEDYAVVNGGHRYTLRPCPNGNGL